LREYGKRGRIMPKICTLNEPYPCEDKVGSKCEICGHAGRNHIYFKELGMGDYCICVVCEGSAKEEELYGVICEYRSHMKFIDLVRKSEEGK